MTKQPFTRDDATLEEGGSLPLKSHVQGDEPVYGEPKGPVGEALFDKTQPGKSEPDRDRNGFIGGKAKTNMGDKVGSGPEEYDHLPKPTEVDDPATND